MQTAKRALALVFVCLFLFLLTACGGGSNNATVYFELEEEPSNLDPQTAYTDSELLLVRNLFEGLMRKNGKGELVNGACSSYEKKGLTYTFTLRRGLKWSDKTAVTAADFVFGIRRAVQKNTAAPFVSRLFCIKGAREIYENGADVSALGVHASGNKVIFNLNEDDPDFLEALSTSVAMPCSEKYFLKTEGKYGQDAKNLLCNGSYDIFKWNKEKFAIRIYKNEYYGGAYTAVNGAVFFSCVADKSQVERLAKSESDIAFVSALELETAREQDISVLSVENICWFMTLGDCYDINVKSALLSAFSAGIYSDALGEGLRPADSIYPGALGINYTAGAGMPVYDLESAKAQMSHAVRNMTDRRFPSATLYYYDRTEIKSAANALLGHWQQNLSAFINMQSSGSLETLQGELNSKTLQFALFPVTAQSGSLKEYLSALGISGQAESGQRQLLSMLDTVPFAFQTTNIAHNSAVKTVYMDNGNGYIDFAYVYKKT